MMRRQKDEIMIRERWLRSNAAFSAGPFHFLGLKAVFYHVHVVVYRHDSKIARFM